MEEQFTDKPVSDNEYYIDNKKYLVVSHYSGEKDVDKVINDIAVKKAYLDMESELRKRKPCNQ